MKKLTILIAATIITSNIHAQAYWMNNSTTYLYNNPTTSNIGIGFSGTPTQKVEVQNGSVYVNSENNGLIVDAAGLKRIGLMKYQGYNTVLSRINNMSFGITRTSSSDIFNSYLLKYDFYIAEDGKVGVGNNTSLLSKFHILNETQDPLNSTFLIQRKESSGTYHGFSVLANGKTKIGLTSPSLYPNASLSVDGQIVCKEVIVTTSAWADFVFDEDYKLPDLNSVKRYISENNHLPNVPSAKEIETNGINLNEMAKIQMQKIEELTLYILELKNEIDQLKQNSK